MEIKKAIAAPFTKGVNFTNWLEFRDAEHVITDMFTRRDFENVKALGCDVIRLPIHFERFCDAGNNYEIAPKILEILDDVVSWAEELKMYIILDFHNNTDAYSVTVAGVESVLTAVWSFIANRYAECSDYIIYEIMNEPHGIEIEAWNGIISRVLARIREIDKKRYVVVGGADWNSFTGMKALPDFKDDRVIYTFHFYDPHTFTHQGASWSKMEKVTGIPFPYDPERMPQTPEDATDEEREKYENYKNVGTIEAVSDVFDKYVEFSLERNAMIYCGEFGVFCPFANPSDRAEWYRIVTRSLAERNISRTSWDYFGAFGIYDFAKMRESFKAHRKPERPKFPEDLDMEIVRALGFDEP